LPQVNGKLDEDRQYMLGLIDEYQQLSLFNKRLYQYFRRMGRVSCPKDLELISARERKEAEEVCRSYESPEEWDAQTNLWMHRFI
jgi:hypothetical protein